MGDPEHPSLSDVGSAKDRRRFGRLRTHEIRTSIGRVLDLSGGGMRVESRWPIRLRAGDLAIISLISEAGEVDLHVRVSWVRPGGLFRCQAGLEFERLTPRLKAMLNYLAQSNVAHHEPSTGWVTPAR